MIDVQSAWNRVKGRWASLRQVPSIFLFAPSIGAEGEEQALAAFGLWCESHPGMRCRVGLSAAWLLHCVPDQDGDAQPPKQQALQQWAHYLDLDEASLDRDWVLREVRLPAAGFLCAAPRTLIEGLQAHAVEHGVQLVWVGPWWAKGLETWLAASAQQGLEVDAVRTLHLLEPGMATHVQASCLPGQAGTLERIWCDRDRPANQGRDAHGMSVDVPDPDPANGVSTQGLWDHKALQSVLTGTDAAWKAQA